MEWKPWNANPPEVLVKDNNCNPWRIDSPRKNYNPADVEWQPQVTAPMPLEALYSLMVENEADPDPDDRNPLDGTNFVGDFLVVVTQEYFQSNPNGIRQSDVTDDVLGFCSLVLSYAKAATNRLGNSQSPKLFTSFMPRTEFNTIYQQVKSKIPGDLFQLFNNLACYRTEDGEVE